MRCQKRYSPAFFPFFQPEHTDSFSAACFLPSQFCPSLINYIPTASLLPLPPLHCWLIIHRIIGILNTFIPYQDYLIGIKWKWCKSHFLLLLKPLTHTQQAVKWATWLPWWTIAVISSVLKHDNITVCFMRATDVITCYYVLLYHWCFCHCQIICHNLWEEGRVTKERKIPLSPIKTFPDISVFS